MSDPRQVLSFRILLTAAALTVSAGAQTGAGVITTIAGATPPGGAPVRGFSGDNGPALGAQLALAEVRNACDSRQPEYEQTVHLAIDSGNIYFTDSANHRIRRINPQGIISTVAGTGEKPPVGGPPFCENTGGAAAIGDGGAATSARFYYPGDIAVTPNKSLLIVDQQNNRIRQISPTGQVSTVIGSGVHNLYAPNIPVTSTPMDWPSAVAVDSTGAIYLVEIHSSRVAKVVNGALATVAGVFPGFAGDGGAAVLARLGRNVTSISLDGNNNLYIADQSNHRIRKVTPDGIINTIAGTGGAGYSGDGGLATSAQLNMPSDVRVDARGNIYIADMSNHRIRRIDPAGVITTVAGDGSQGRGPDGVVSTASSLNHPVAIALDTNGDLYIVDWQNYLIRKVSFGGQPVISPGAIVNAASFAPPPVPVAPGSIISLFGVNFASEIVSATAVPLPTSLANVSVRLNGTLLPLFFVSPSQINAQVPYDAAIGNATVTVTNQAGTSTSESLTIGPAAVGIFQYGGSTRAVTLNQDGTPNSPENPESRGRVIVAYLTGQGAVDPAIPTGEAASLTILSPAVGSSVATIGGENAKVLFLGLAPGFVGVAQANIEIPANSATGSSVPVVISVDGQASNAPTISIR